MFTYLSLTANISSVSFPVFTGVIFIMAQNFFYPIIAAIQNPFLSVTRDIGFFPQNDKAMR
jgi:hypothetical protein